MLQPQFFPATVSPVSSAAMMVIAGAVLRGAKDMEQTEDFRACRYSHCCDTRSGARVRHTTA